ncbi:alpha-1,2-mannosyltransferase [Chiua virens]|nr:alpha-1,2-mannosyltransferase [Chiua virens]
MAIPIRYVFIAVFFLALFFVTFRLSNLSLTLGTFSPTVPADSSQDTDTLTLSDFTPSVSSDARERANATFIILCRNSDLDGVIQSVQSAEDRFNREYNYPYVFLNEEPFDEQFKRRISVLSNAQMEFGIIPHDHWYAPSWIDEQKAADARKKMEEDKVIYGGSLPYRNMCRFNSGFFFRHPLLQKYRYYWRIEPWVRFHCDVPSDPLRFMQDYNKTYGFTISLYEFQATIPSLWDRVKEYARAHPDTLHPNNALGFISDDTGSSYNLCHFWSNFEIGDMDFWRGETYTSFFEFLDRAGGFYYERWGDAPVHSIAAALFLPRNSIHFFNDIGYEHPPFTHCPIDKQRWASGRCSCNPDTSFDYDGYSCLRRWEALDDQ